MVAVGGLLPLPVIALYGLEGGLVFALSVVHLIVYLGVFYYLARRIRTAVTGGIVLLILFALSFLPIYGSGENLASGGKMNLNAYQAYQQGFVEVFGKR